MKIGIVTFTTGDNFGQRLQNYALQNILEKQGASVQTLRKIDFRLKKVYWLKTILTAIVDNNKLQLFCKHRCFVEFDKKYIRYFTQQIDGKKVPKRLRENFDRFVVGSDQVWSPLSGDVDEFYFLTFAKDNQKYCYAPSFSVDSIPVDKADQYKKWLDSFRILNSREYAGQRIMSQLGYVSDIAIDPTLLIDKEAWVEIEHKPKWLKDNQNYALKYYLGNQGFNDINTYATTEDCIVIDILDTTSEYYSIGPREFLYLIEHAKIVFTDSYHGTIFSILMETPFQYFERKDNLNDMSSRFDTLFKWFDIKNADSIINPKDLDMNLLDELRKNSMKIIKEIVN